MNKATTIVLHIMYCLLTTLLISPIADAGIDSYIVSSRRDGGYTLAVRYSKRHWKPITPEGFFPLEEGICVLEIKGTGEKRESGETKGTFYTSADITGRSQIWDTGYAWIDDKGKNLYLNLYWATPPVDIAPSYINGKYNLDHSDTTDSQLLKWMERYREK